MEVRADRYSLQLTDAPDALIAMQRRLALQNVAEPDPPRLLHRLTGSHPSTVERIALAERYVRGRECGGPASG